MITRCKLYLRTLRASTLALVLFALVFSFAPSISAQVSVALAPVARQQFFSATGVPLAGGCVFTFSAGTTTPAATYIDINGIVQNANPLTLDGGGFAVIYLANQSYKIQVNAAPATGNCSAVNFGAQQWVQDNVSAYQIILNISNLFLLPVTSDPAGTAGEIGYRSDIPCFRGFTTLWDCFTMNNLAQTLTNKTLTAPIINNAVGASFTSPSITGLTVGGIAVATGNATNFVNFTNGAAGTTLNQLAKLVPVGGGVTAVNTAITDTGGVVGIVVAGANTSGVNVTQRTGQVLCTFDASTTVDDYVQISTTFPGNCHDSGSTSYPTAGGQIIGRVLTTNVGAGNYLIDLFPPEIRPPASPVVITAVNTTAIGANVVSTPILTPAANGFYRASCYLVLTQAATVSSTLPVCSVTYNDADTNAAETQNLTLTSGANTVGTTSTLGASIFYFFAKTGVAISYQTTGYATNGATSMQYALHLRLEGPF